MTNGLGGRTNGLGGRTNGLGGRTNGMTNGLGRTNGLTNGLGRTNGMTNGLTNGLGRPARGMDNRAIAPSRLSLVLIGPDSHIHPARADFPLRAERQRPRLQRNQG